MMVIAGGCIWFAAAALVWAADLNIDGDVDLNDHAIFARCVAGPNVTTPPAECTEEEFDLADLDDDGDVDALDGHTNENSYHVVTGDGTTYHFQGAWTAVSQRTPEGWKLEA